MATRNNDLLFIFSGGVPFSQTFDVGTDFDLQPYQRVNAGRKLLSASHGADNDINANVESVMVKIRDFTKTRMDTIGQVCLLGRSNGCALALALAVKLNEAGVNDISFVGVSDVPMWDTGRVPPVNNVGDFKPINGVVAAGAVSPNPGIGGFLSVGNTTEVPVITLSKEIKARTKVNLFQTQGNHMRWSNSVKKWFWFSDFSAGEVHGKIGGGFEERLRKVNETFFLDRDLKLHISLNTKEHWKQMVREASDEFAKGLPT